MTKWGIPQLFEMWRKSVLFTVGAISLGAEELESQLGRLLKKGEGNDRAPRVKVPVRAAKATSVRSTRPVMPKNAQPKSGQPKNSARSARKPVVKASRTTSRSIRKVKAQPTPITPITATETNAL